MFIYVYVCMYVCMYVYIYIYIYIYMQLCQRGTPSVACGCSLYLLYKHKSTNTDRALAMQLAHVLRPVLSKRFEYLLLI